MEQDRLAHRLADGHARVEGGIGVLEDDLQVAPVGAHAALVEDGQILALEHHLAGGRLVQVQDGEAGGGLAAAGFADKAQRLALDDLEA